MSAPWLSVIVPTYNGAAYLARTLDSIARQREDGLEVLAVDDGSSDATLAILRGYSRQLPLRVFARSRACNWVANTNYGLRAARGEYACFLHQDDVWLPNRLSALRSLLARDPDAALILHPSRYIDARGRGLGLWRCPLRAGRQKTGAVVEQLLVQNFIAVPAPLFAREAALRAGGLDEDLWYTADWDFWLKLAGAGPTVYHPEPLTAFRLHAQSQTARGVARADEMRRQIEAVLTRHLPAWEALHPRRGEVALAARLSLEVNHALAGCAHGRRPKWLPLARSFLSLGVRGWFRFLRDSRIVERLGARLRVRGRPAGGEGAYDRAGVRARLDAGPIQAPLVLGSGGGCGDPR